MSQKETVYKQAAIPREPNSMPYVQVAPGGRYFMTEDGEPFLVIGHNDAMPWPNMHNMHYEDDIATTEAYIKMLAEHGVTVLRIMLEYCQNSNWYFENPVGCFVPDAVLYWDDLIGLCERYKVRLLVLFWDTFFMSNEWKHHPYSKENTGFDGHWSICTGGQAMEAEKARIRFFIDRWGNSPAIFAYDVLNEIHPHWGGTPDEQHAWVAEMARFIKSYEMERWGKRHLLTLSVFGSKPEGGYIDLIFRHPELDFATTHVYEFGVVDNPDNTVDGALVMRDAVRYAYANMTVPRPYTDTESGPIHLYMDLKRSLPDAFEEEYYHNMCWAHLASGGAGSGMRWPFRDPHCLSPQMHAVQLGMAQFLPAIEWTAYSPQPIEQMLQVVSRTSPGCDCHAVPLRDVLPFGCSDGRQALIWLLRDCRLEEAAQEKRAADLLVPCLHPGEYHAEFWETYSGTRIGEHHFRVGVEPGSMPPGGAQLPLPDFDRDVAVAIRPAHD